MLQSLLLKKKFNLTKEKAGAYLGYDLTCQKIVCFQRNGSYTFKMVL